MSTLAYEIVDVFTDQPFAGNPLDRAGDTGFEHASGGAHRAHQVPMTGDTRPQSATANSA